jgi:hypothetical protein
MPALCSPRVTAPRLRAAHRVTCHRHHVIAGAAPIRRQTGSRARDRWIDACSTAAQEDHMKLSIIVSVCLVALTTIATAGTVPGPKGSGVKVFAPDGWEIAAAEHEGEAIMITASPKEDCSFVWAVANAQNLDKALGAVDKLLSKFVTDGKVGKASKTTLNGMPALLVEGTAKHDGKPVTAGVVIAQPKPGKVLIAVGLVHTAKKATYQKTFEQVLAGIQPTR